LLGTAGSEQDEPVTKVHNSYVPYGLRAEEAANYLGMGRSKFLELVGEGRLPKPKVIDGMRIWDRRALEAAFDDFTEHRDGGRRNSFDDILGAD
jgi:excisionase family DNA binding protein